MSAIFGIIRKDQKEIEPETIRKMSDVLKHRAVDGSGIYHSGPVMIGHHKFITNNTQKTEKLPYEDNEFVITSDARIDNRDELYRKLELRPKLAEIHDSILILESYKKWGDQCTDHLEGEFAFVIWNKQTRTLFSATDHIGFRTFYYYDTGEMFVFASEIKGILAVKTGPKILTDIPVIIAEAITRNYTGATFDRDIFILMAGNQLRQSGHSKIKINKYWYAKPRGKYRFTKDHEWPECLRELLTQSVQNRLNTDKPVGIWLSGGLDSSFIAAIASGILKKQNRTLYAFSSVLPEDHQGPEKDERYWINLLGKHLGNIDQTFVYLPLEIGPFTNLGEVFKKGEIPVNNFHYMDTALFNAAKDKKVNLLFTGFGGDSTISNKGQGVIYELIKEGKVVKSSKYFMKVREKYQASYLTLFKTEILYQTRFYQLISEVPRILLKQRYPYSLDTLIQIMKSRVKYGSVNPYKYGISKQINWGNFGREMFNISNQGPSCEVELAIPIFDKCINDFFLDLPSDQLLLKGHKRSLIRRAMESLVPHEIHNRNNKNAYTPDFLKRVVSKRAEIDNRINLYSTRTELTDTHFNVKQARKKLLSLSDVEATKLTNFQILSPVKSCLIEEYLHWLISLGYSIQ